MAYLLPAPNFKVQNLLNQNDAGATNRLLSWKPVTNAATYNIYRSFVEYTGFEKVATVTGTQWTDLTLGMISNNDFKDLEAQTINTWSTSGSFGWYYKMSAVRADGTEGAISGPKSDLDFCVLNNLPGGNYSVGDATFCVGADLPDASQIAPYIDEIAQRDLALLQMNGQYVWFFKQLAEGKRCPYWADDLSQCERGKKCELCHGTGLQVGGFYPPVKILVRLVGAPRQLISERYGLRQYYESSSWTYRSPVFAQRDFFVDRFGRRHEITSVSPNIIMAGLTTVQNFTHNEMLVTDPRMKLSVPGALY